MKAVSANKNNKQAVLLFGCFGCGKATHGGAISSMFEVPYLDMGLSLRGRALDNKEGGLSPDGIVREIGSAFIMQNQDSPMLFLDGWPRNIAQAEEVIPFLQQMGYADIMTLHFVINPYKCVERLVAKPRPGREEDLSVLKMARRLVEYYEQTHPVIPFLHKHTRVVPIDNTVKPIEEVRQEILAALGLREMQSVPVG